MKQLRGTVVSTKMTGTVVVAVEMPKRHPLYDKIIKNTRRFKVKKEAELVVGDTVIIEECNPVSKETAWKVIEKIEKKEK
jgi:small subunit ribosomal protein S17